MVADFHGIDFRQGLLGCGVIEDAGDAETELPGAGPCVILQDEIGVELGGFRDLAKRQGGIGPRRAVDDQAGHHVHEALGENLGKLALPPKGERQVGIEVGEDGVAETAGDAAGEVEGNLLAADGFPAVGEVAVGGDPGTQAGQRFGAVDLDEDRAAGVIPGEVADDGGVFPQGAGFLGIDDEIHQRGVGACVVLLPEFAEFLFDLGDRNFESEFRANGGDGGVRGGRHADAGRSHRTGAKASPPDRQPMIGPHRPQE